MMRFFFSLALTANCLLFFACSERVNSERNNTSGSSSAETKTISAENIYKENCALCHGPDGKKGTLGAKDLSISDMDKNQAVEIITNGKGQMAPYKSLLTPEEIDAVADYVLTLKK